MSGQCCYWKIKCMERKGAMVIGITTQRYVSDSYAFHIDSDQLFYALDNVGIFESIYTESMYGMYYSEGDTVKMNLDLVKKELSFELNEKGKFDDEYKEYGVACRNIYCDKHTKYYLAIAMWGQRHSMQIVDFGYY